MNTLIAVAHGSRDARSAQTVFAVAERIRARRPDLDVRVAFLDLTEPSVEAVIDDVASEGTESAVVVPLLLGSAFHARVDLPGIVTAARSRHPRLRLVQSEVLGDDRRLVDALRERIVESGVTADDASVGVVLAAVGSSHAQANNRTRALADRVVRGTSWNGAVTGFATSRSPTAQQAVTQLRAAGSRTLVIAPWFLAPGLLLDRVRDSVTAAPMIDDDTVIVHASVLGDHPFVADVVSSRYDAALAGLGHRRTA